MSNICMYVEQKLEFRDEPISLPIVASQLSLTCILVIMNILVQISYWL